MCGQSLDEIPPELDPWKNGMAQRYYNTHTYNKTTISPQKELWLP